MIDFNSNSVFILRKDKTLDFKLVEDIIISNEQVLQTYTTVRDKVIFTNKRVIAVNVQGITGAKKDFTSLPYSKIQAFSIETAGVIDADAELDLWFSSVGKVRFRFYKDCVDASEINRIISENVLG